MVSLLLIGAAVYFFIVLPVNRSLARMRRGDAAPEPTTKKCPECLSDIPIALAGAPSARQSSRRHRRADQIIWLAYQHCRRAVWEKTRVGATADSAISQHLSNWREGPIPCESNGKSDAGCRAVVFGNRFRQAMG